MSDWSTARVEQLAPDPASAKAGHGLAKPSHWKNLGQRDGVVWGECQGSGANPYQVRASLTDVGYRCTCPSRKQPCKHILGLLLLYAGGASLPDTAPPAFVEEWLANRTKRAEAKAAREEAVEAPDPEEQARRIGRRESRIDAGLDQLEAWLADAATQGLAALRAQPPTYWGQMRARLVDAQAPGLARRVAELGDSALRGADWQTRLLAGLARLQLLVDAYRRIESLEPELGAEVRALVGWTQKQDELLAHDGIRDRWHVIARRLEEQDALKIQSTWLAGAASKRIALVLEFAVGRAPLPVTFAVGEILDAELVFFPGVIPLRAVLKARHSGSMGARLPAGIDARMLQDAFAAVLAKNPWLDRCPAVLGPMTPTMQGDRCVLVDATGRRIATRGDFRHGWSLVALAGTAPLALFGEWDGFEFDVHSVECGGVLQIPGAIGVMPILDRAS